ncbi:MAG: Wzt carbohydrate-binding domain-containing protein, partial [Leptospiraceae bacterium]|nr:Wzt carbohydrate-binding domain-containing protein [Leptospiraceae bacterium]
TVLFVSHSMSSVKKLCDRAILLDGGEVEASGDVSDIVEIYLSGGKARAESGAGPIYFAPREDLAMQILSVALVDETGQPRDKFVVGESPVLQIEYEVRQPIDGMAIQFQLMRNGDAVLTQADNESPASDDIRPPGKYRVRVQMPDFLNAGKFVFSAIQTNRLRKTATNHSVRLDQKEAMLHFEIREAEEQRRIISHALEAGPVVSDQSWQTKLLLRSKNTPDSSGSAIL